MSKYTTEVRYLCEVYAGLDQSLGYANVNSIIQKAIPKIFDFDFPIFDEAYRNVLCTKILKHYYTREIGEEVVGLWKLRLDTRLNEIMPFYNQMYKSELLEFNPLYDTDLTTHHDSARREDKTVQDDESANRDTKDNRSRVLSDTSNSTNTQNVESTGQDNFVTNNTQWDLLSDTPQGALTNVEEQKYLTNARKIKNDDDETRNTNDTSQSTSDANYKDDLTETNDDTFTENSSRNRESVENINTTDSYIQAITGKSGGVSYSKMLQEFRQTFLNIDLQVIDDLKDLFMTLW